MQDLESRKSIWKEAYGSDQPLTVDEAAEQYASWNNDGRPGETAKECAFEASETFKGSRRGVGLPNQ